MRAVGYRKSLPIDDPQSLLDIESTKPGPKGRDLLVQVKAVSVNPVDTKVRKRAAPKEGEPAKILGYDATGVVAATGPEVTLVKAGDEGWDAPAVAGARLLRSISPRQPPCRSPRSPHGKCCSTASRFRAAAPRADRC